MILRLAVVIPTFDNAETIQEVVLDALRELDAPVVVIDDGSRVPVERRLTHPDCRANLASGRLRVLRHVTNRGKGAALRTAISDCLAHGFTHMLSMDGDGQHPAREACKLASTAREHPWDLILGNRNLRGTAVPPASRFGRLFSNFWVRFETDRVVADSQSGLRVYPLFHVQNLRFFSRRFDFEIEVLIRMLWRGVGVRDVDVDVSYSPSGLRVSHFHKLRDNARISLLNMLLVTASLFRTDRSLRAMSVALGLGVWIGTTPFFGFHTPLAIAFALLFRLNVLVLWLGTNISNPFLVGPLTALSAFVGQWILGGSLRTVGGFASSWLVGSMVVGSALGLITGIVAFVIASRMRRRSLSKRRGWTGKSRGGRFGNWFMKAVARRFGLRAARAFLGFIVPYFYVAAPKARKACAEYWKNLAPDDSFLCRQGRVLRHFRTFAILLLDRAFQGFPSKPPFRTNAVGVENLRGGLVIVTAHCGAWDLASVSLPAELQTAFKTVQYRADETAPADVIVTNRVSQPVFAIREILLSGRPVGFMADRPVGGRGELIPFLGKLALFDPTPFRIAALCEVPVVFSFGFKGEGETYEFSASFPKSLTFAPGADHDLQCFNWLTEFVRELETRIRRYPYQWLNFFPFWGQVPN